MRGAISKEIPHLAAISQEMREATNTFQTVNDSDIATSGTILR